MRYRGQILDLALFLCGLKIMFCNLEIFMDRVKQDENYYLIRNEIIKTSFKEFVSSFTSQAILAQIRFLPGSTKFRISTIESSDVNSRIQNLSLTFWLISVLNIQYLITSEVCNFLYQRCSKYQWRIDGICLKYKNV